MKKIIFIGLALLLLASLAKNHSSEKRGEFHSFSHSFMEKLLQKEEARAVFDLQEEEYQAVFRETGEETFL